MKYRRAFTLVEIVISVLILGIVMSALLGLFSSIFKSYEFHQDVDEAKERGVSALAVIRRYVMNAGLGLPNTQADFQSAFAGQTKILPVLALNDVRNFRAPVQLASNDVISTQTEAPQLWVVYSIPSGAGVNLDYTVSNTATKVFVNKYGSLDAANKLSTIASDLKAWVSFPGCMSAFRITAWDAVDETITLQSAIAQKISAFDEIHFVRAAKIKVRTTDMSLVVDDLMGAGEQPLVSGIVGMSCAFDPTGDRVLKVTVLARANTRHAEEVTAAVDGWSGSIPDKHYRYAAVSRSWRIRN